MNANALNFDVRAMAQPMSKKDFIALAEEMLSELACVKGHLQVIVEKCGELESA